MKLSRFINIAGDVKVSRPNPAQQSSAHSFEGQDVAFLAEEVRKMKKRISELEMVAPRPYVEFELNVDNSGTTLYRLPHYFSKPVRYWVTYWNHPSTSATDPTAGPCLIASDTSTLDQLVLTSKVTGRAVVRVEPVDYTLTGGP